MDGFFDAAASSIGKTAAGASEAIGTIPGLPKDFANNAKFFGKDFTQEFDQIAKDGQGNGIGYQVGSGIGTGLSLLAGGLPGALGQVAAQSFGETYAQTGDAGKAALSSLAAVPEMAAYWLVGGVAGKIVAPLLKHFTPLGKALATGLVLTIL